MIYFILEGKMPYLGSDLNRYKIAGIASVTTLDTKPDTS